jgi:hypothetical protein
VIGRYRKQILLFAAIANIVAGIMALAAPTFHFEQLFIFFEWESSLIAHVMMYHIMFWVIVIIMGIGYWMTARTPDENRVMLFIGGAGKLACAIVWLYSFSMGMGNWLMISGTIYDGTFGILFLILFFTSRKQTN